MRGKPAIIGATFGFRPEHSIDVRMRRVFNQLLIVSMLLSGNATNAAAQVPPAARAAISGGVGLAEGVIVSLAVIVARARFQNDYVESPRDVLDWGWKAIPVVAAPVAGVAFGLAGDDAFSHSLAGSAAGIAIGASVGGLVGRLTSDAPENTWAGAIIGAGAGLTIGRVLFGVLEWNDGDDDDPPSMSLVFRATP
jgi:hypothetical protein